MKNREAAGGAEPDSGCRWMLRLGLILPPSGRDSASAGAAGKCFVALFCWEASSPLIPINPCPSVGKLPAPGTGGLKAKPGQVRSFQIRSSKGFDQNSWKESIQNNPCSVWAGKPKKTEQARMRCSLGSWNNRSGWDCAAIKDRGIPGSRGSAFPAPVTGSGLPLSSQQWGIGGFLGGKMRKNVTEFTREARGAGMKGAGATRSCQHPPRAKGALPGTSGHGG